MEPDLPLPDAGAFNARLDAKIALLEAEADTMADPVAAARLRALAGSLRRSLIEDSGHCCCEHEGRTAGGH